MTLPQEGSFQSHLCMHCQGYEVAVLLQVTTNRGLILKTLETKGPEYAGEMGLQNVRDLLPIIQWNYENGVRLFRQAAGGCACWELQRSVWPCRAGWCAVDSAAESLLCLFAQQISLQVFTAMQCTSCMSPCITTLEHSTCFLLHTNWPIYPGWVRQATLKAQRHCWLCKRATRQSCLVLQLL